MNWYLASLKKYVDFSGRARRKEYWIFSLLNFIFAFAAMFLDNLLGLTIGPDAPYGPVYILFALAVIVPGFAVTVRRLHDTDKSGWWIFINLIPCIGPIWFLILMITDSTAGANEYGPNPKE